MLLGAIALAIASSGCATMERLSERLCGIEVLHSTFCDGSPEEPEEDE